ncbi:MAG: DUF1232 domain-containing protein [Anaerolineae bacterium]|nr:DUF1232 domain-containing protein [Anaerolineae bacterium]
MSEKNNDSRERMQYPDSTRQANVVVAGMQDFFGQFRLAWRLLLDGRVPSLTKIVPLLTALYVLSPVDLVPDLALGLGQLDDLAIFLVGLRLFVELCPPDLVEELKSAHLIKRNWTPSEGPVIDLEARLPSDVDEDKEDDFETFG